MAILSKLLLLFSCKCEHSVYQQFKKNASGAKVFVKDNQKFTLCR